VIPSDLILEVIRRRRARDAETTGVELGLTLAPPTVLEIHDAWRWLGLDSNRVRLIKQMEPAMNAQGQLNTKGRMD
jgi:hypothetical protein